MWKVREPWTLVLGLALIAFLAWQLGPRPAGTTKPSKVALASELRTFQTVILIYAADWDDRIPAVDSQALPDWWRDYSKHDQISGIRFWTAKSAIGRKASELKADEVLLEASGPQIDDTWKREGTRLSLSVEGRLREVFCAE